VCGPGPAKRSGGYQFAADILPVENKAVAVHNGLDFGVLVNGQLACVLQSYSSKKLSRRHSGEAQSPANTHSLLRGCPI
jgi:hypothetical protein